MFRRPLLRAGMTRQSEHEGFGWAMKTQIDHLVVMVKSLDDGVQWCEATFGVTPGPGGEHAQFGTHNRLFKIATPANPLAYLEIIAVHSGAARPSNAPRKRWFDMDDDAVQAAVAVGPRLVHFVVSTSDIQAGRAALKALDIERGPAVQASRHSRRGLLQWRITVREDGQRLFDGALPTLIQWGKPDDADPLRLHPRNSLPRSGVSLQTMTVTHPSADKLKLAYEAIGLAGVAIHSGPANITATFQSPRGVVELSSNGV